MKVTLLNSRYTVPSGVMQYYPRANGAKRRSGRKPGARVTNSALVELKVVARGSKGVGMS